MPKPPVHGQSMYWLIRLLRTAPCITYNPFPWPTLLLFAILISYSHVASPLCPWRDQKQEQGHGLGTEIGSRSTRLLISDYGPPDQLVVVALRGHSFAGSSETCSTRGRGLLLSCPSEECLTHAMCAGTRQAIADWKPHFLPSRSVRRLL